MIITVILVLAIVAALAWSSYNSGGGVIGSSSITYGQVIEGVAAVLLVLWLLWHWMSKKRD